MWLLWLLWLTHDQIVAHSARKGPKEPWGPRRLGQGCPLAHSISGGPRAAGWLVWPGGWPAAASRSHLMNHT